MEKSQHMGMNRTGVDISPMLSKEMVKDAQAYSPRAMDGNKGIAALERSYLQANSSVGSVPMPGTMKGALKSAGQKLAGRNPEVLINKLGERLAYERTGVRLYESFIRKCEARNGSARTPVPMDQLRRICSEEAEHFQLIKECMEQLGADPTAQTPDADVSGVAATGFMQVLTDPRTSISQCLGTLLSVEMTDRAAWELLISLCDGAGLDQMSERFRHALRQEQEHERLVRQWYEDAVISQTGVGAKSRASHSSQASKGGDIAH